MIDFSQFVSDELEFIKKLQQRELGFEKTKKK